MDKDFVTFQTIIALLFRTPEYTLANERKGTKNFTVFLVKVFDVEGHETNKRNIKAIILYFVFNKYFLIKASGNT